MEYDGKFLILRRHPEKKQGGTWGLPAGKVDAGEDDAQSAAREIYEETGYQTKTGELELLGAYPFEFPEYDVTFPTYRIRLQKPLDVKLQPSEHTEFRWVTAEECYAMKDLIYGFHELLVLTGYIA